MNRLFLLISCIVLSSVVCLPADLYTSKYDNIDLDEILKSERLLQRYFDCLMTGKSCTPDGAELKKHLPDAIETNCSKCTAKQKDGTKKVIIFLIKNKPDKWKQLEAKYDPDGTYKQKHKEELEKAGVVY